MVHYLGLLSLKEKVHDFHFSEELVPLITKSQKNLQGFFQYDLTMALPYTRPGGLENSTCLLYYQAKNVETLLSCIMEGI